MESIKKNSQCKKDIIFLDYFEDPREAVPCIQKICRNRRRSYLIISSNFDIEPLKIYPELEVLHFDELLTREDYTALDKYIFNLTRTWYSKLIPREGVTEYQGISFGEIVEERARRLFTSTVKNLEIVLKIKERFDPSEIILICRDDIFSGFDKFIQDGLNISTSIFKVHNRTNVISRLMIYVKRLIAEALTGICDTLIRLNIPRLKRKRGIFIDAHLHFELEKAKNKPPQVLYLIEKGFRIRWKLLMNKKLPFVPFQVEYCINPFRILHPFRIYYESMVSQNVQFQDEFRYKKLPISKILNKNIKELVIYAFPIVKTNALLLKKTYKFLEPKIIVLKEAVRGPERTIVLTAKQVGIPTLVVQHGFLSEENVYTKLYPSRIAMWGKAGTEWYGSFGNDVTKCVVTGKLHHDAVYSNTDGYAAKGREILSSIGANPDKDIILHISSFFKGLRHLGSVYEYQDSEFVVLNSILDIAESFPDKQFIVKLHPFDLVDMSLLYNNSRIHKARNVFIIKDADITALIKVSSLVITSLFSSATMDAVIFNKPVITLNFSKRDDFIPFAQRGVALKVDDPTQLLRAIREIYEDKKVNDRFASNRANFIYDYAYKIDGQSTERVSKLIDALCYSKSETKLDL